MDNRKSNSFRDRITNAPLRIVAQFASASQAKAAREGINSLLSSAYKEFADLLSRQNGEANSVDVALIYAKYGLRNDIGWSQDQPLISLGEDVIWEAPAGLDPEDAENILLAFGAHEISVHVGLDEPWREMPNPMLSLDIDEDFDFLEEDEEEFQIPLLPDKKLLH